MRRFLTLILGCLIPSMACGQTGEADNLCQMGMDFYHQGKLDASIEKFTDAIAANPKSAFAYKCRSFVWEAKGDDEKAVADLDKTITLDPNDAAAHFSRGNLWRRKGDLDKALKDYGSSIRLNPKNTFPYINRGTVYVEQGEYSKAWKDYSKAIRLDPEMAPALSGRAWIMATCPVADLRNGEKALEEATRANERSGWKQADQLDTLAAAYAELGKFEQAQEFQQKAIDLATDAALIHDLRLRLRLYESKKPYRSKPRKGPAKTP